MAWDCGRILSCIENKPLASGNAHTERAVWEMKHHYPTIGGWKVFGYWCTESVRRSLAKRILGLLQKKEMAWLAGKTECEWVSLTSQHVQLIKPVMHGAE
jgi:hypothetical protein